MTDLAFHPDTVGVVLFGVNTALIGWLLWSARRARAARAYVDRDELEQVDR